MHRLEEFQLSFNQIVVATLAGPALAGVRRDHNKSK
jgi:hypothetical protein